jgi:hypothetical protein
MFILTISHNIYLTKEERYKLHKEKAIEVVGVSLPLLIEKNKIPSSPNEVFCRYQIINDKKRSESIKIFNNGYRITLPQDLRKRKPKLNLDDWRFLKEKEKINWYQANPSPKTPDNLLDVPNGSGGFLSFNCNTILKKIDVLHFIEIAPIEILHKSLI